MDKLSNSFIKYLSNILLMDCWRIGLMVRVSSAKGHLELAEIIIKDNGIGI